MNTLQPVLPIDVYQAALKRLNHVFDRAEYVYVSFSGGKDSGALLNLALKVADERGRRIGIFHIDYEAQYQSTTDYVAATLDGLRDRHDVWHICLPISAQCATSMHQDHWTPWHPDMTDLWVRPRPAGAITLDDPPNYFRFDMWDYEFQDKFGAWLKTIKGVSSVACLIGIRAQESLNRWRAICSADRVFMQDGLSWTKVLEPGVFNAYPLYDWSVEDVWSANARFGWTYNRLYDLFYLAGVPLHKMRVASPFNDAATESLKLYKVIDPNTWGKMVGRVNGVNFTGIYGGTTAMGWKNITKPPHFTWKQYMEFLLSTLPEAAQRNYRQKLEASKKSWVVGGGVDEETIRQLEAEGAPFRRAGRNTNRGHGDKAVIVFDDYVDDTTIDNFRRIPSYKRMCICIMKNDHHCKYMGFAMTKQEMDRRKAAIEKYRDL